MGSWNKLVCYVVLLVKLNRIGLKIKENQITKKTSVDYHQMKFKMPTWSYVE